MKRAILALLAAWALVAPAAAQVAPPAPPPTAAPAAPAPRDIPYPGVIRLQVDATDTDRRVFRVKETLPVAAAGPLVLLYPEWLPGAHAPRGPLDKLAGLVIRAGGQPVPWRRDPLDAYAFQLEVPRGVSELELEFQFLSATDPSQGRVVITPEMLNLQWNAVTLYPAGHFARRIAVEPELRLPAGWRHASALEVAGTEGDLVRFKPVDLETLVDSPLFAGRHFKGVDLDAGGRGPVRMNIFADRPELLAATPDQIERHRELVRQADKLYGARHFDRYDFLVALTERMGGIGLEHHRSSENGTRPAYFTEWAQGAPLRDLLPHEYAHSWNGKFRRPADLWTPNFNAPMQNSLLWVYEGQTQYWGHVLSARSGLLSKEQALDALAATAAAYEHQAGREWRDLQDTTNDPVISARRAQPWASWQRSEDYYSEGQLVWLDADTLIRERSGGRRSLDDFARAFFGLEDGSWTPVTYRFEDVVAGLNRVQAHDWASFLATRIQQVAPRAPLDGLTRGGYRLVYTETPTDYFRQNEARRGLTDLSYSLGLILGREGEIRSVLWNGPAFKAGLTSGGKVLAVDGVAYDAGRLREAISGAKTAARAISLIVKTGDHYRMVAIDYRGGLRYPRLERIPGAPDRLSAIYAPRR